MRSKLGRVAFRVSVQGTSRTTSRTGTDDFQEWDRRLPGPGVTSSRTRTDFLQDQDGLPPGPGRTSSRTRTDCFQNRDGPRPGRTTAGTDPHSSAGGETSHDSFVRWPKVANENSRTLDTCASNISQQRGRRCWEEALEEEGDHCQSRTTSRTRTDTSRKEDLLLLGLGLTTSRTGDRLLPRLSTSWSCTDRPARGPACQPSLPGGPTCPRTDLPAVGRPSRP